MTENAMKPYVIGLDLGGTNSVFGIVDARGDIKATTAIKTGGYKTVDEYVKASVEALQPVLDTIGGIEKIKGMEKRIEIGRYHSWVVDRTNFPECLDVTAVSDDGCIMGLKHKNYDIHGIQFHPESVLTSEGKTIVKNFLEL